MEHVSREPRPEKVAAVELLTEKFNKANSIFLTDFSGLSVEDITELRRQFRAKDVEYLVVKNTLAERGAQNAGHEGMVPYLVGPIAVALGYDDPAEPARVIAEFRKSHDKPEVKACIIEGDVLPGSEAANIAKWPSREELLASLVGSLNSPISGLVMSLSGLPRKLVYALNAIREKKESGS